VVFLASDPGGCTLDATGLGEREFLQAAENKGFEKIGTEIRRQNRKVNSPAHWMVVNTLTTSFQNEERVAKEEEPAREREASVAAEAGENAKCLSECLTNSRERNHRNCI
jgi:hypothetical protein